MKLFLASIVAACLAGVAAAAGSAGVEHTSGFFTKTVPIEGLCDFPVIFTIAGVNQETDFTDASGRLVRTIQTGALTETFSAHGQALTSRAAGPLITTFDPATGEITSFQIAGLGFAVTLPGHGVILLSAGLTRLADGSFTVAGPFVQDPAFCAALA